MGLLENLSSGKYNLVLFGILFIFIFHQYWIASSNTGSTRQSLCKDNKEPMADVSNDIKEAIKQVYLADVEAIRNLSEVATKLQKEGLTIPGDLTVTGQIKVGKTINASGEINNNNLSLSGLNSQITNLTNTINNLSNQINNNKSAFDSLNSTFNSFKSNFDGYEFKRVCLRNSTSGYKTLVDYDKTCDDIGIQNIKNSGWDWGGFSAIIPTKGRYT